MSNSSIQYEIKNEIGSLIYNLAGRIQNKDLYKSVNRKSGRETNPHITLFSGIDSVNSTEIKKALKLFPLKSLKLKFGKTTLFERELFDVVKIDVVSEDLNQLYEYLTKSICFEDLYGAFKPHCTIAYVKSGLGSKYKGLNKLAGKTIEFSDITFVSGYNKSKTIIKLNKTKLEKTT